MRTVGGTDISGECVGVGLITGFHLCQQCPACAQ